MSIEQAIERNTAALEQLIAVWASLTNQAKAIKTQVDAGEITTVTAGGAIEVEVETQKPVAPTVAAAPAVTPAPAEPAQPAEVSYETVSKAITEKAKSDRAAVVALLAKFGAKKGTELKPEQYADFMKEVA